MGLISGWKQYQMLLAANPYEAPMRPSVYPLPPKKKKRNSSRKSEEGFSYIAYRFRGYPNEQQEKILSRTFGSCRFLWNRMVADRLDFYRIMGKTLKNTPADYKDIEGLEFLKEADSLALANVQRNVERAFSDWLSGKRAKPQFKKKNFSPASYTTYASGNNIRLTNSGLNLPKVPGQIKIKVHRTVRKDGKLKNVTVIREPNGKWYFSILIQYPAQEESNTFLESQNTTSLKIIGLDMSLPHMYIDSNGEIPRYYNHGWISFEKHYHILESRIAREQRKLSRMVRDSSNYRKQCMKIARLYAKTKHQREDFLHQIACRLAREYDVVVIEDLDIARIKKSLRFGKSVSDNGWGQFITFLEEQCKKYHHLLLWVSRWFPSSRTCISCGNVHKKLKLSDRTFCCPVCGNVINRDLQAALNIRKEGIRILKQYQKPRLPKTVQTYHINRRNAGDSLWCYGANDYSHSIIFPPVKQE